MINVTEWTDMKDKSKQAVKLITCIIFKWTGKRKHEQDRSPRRIRSVPGEYEGQVCIVRNYTGLRQISLFRTIPLDLQSLNAIKRVTKEHNMHERNAFSNLI